MNKKAQKEKALVNLVVGLQDVYFQLRTSDPPDLAGLRTLALCYEKCGMPERGREILREVNRMTEVRKYVPDGGIIDDNTGYGGPNEKTIPVRVDRPGCPIPGILGGS